MLLGVFSDSALIFIGKLADITYRFPRDFWNVCTVVAALWFGGAVVSELLRQWFEHGGSGNEHK